MPWQMPILFMIISAHFRPHFWPLFSIHDNQVTILRGNHAIYSYARCVLITHLTLRDKHANHSTCLSRSPLCVVLTQSILRATCYVLNCVVNYSRLVRKPSTCFCIFLRCFHAHFFTWNQRRLTCRFTFFYVLYTQYPRNPNETLRAGLRFYHVSRLQQ